MNKSYIHSLRRPCKNRGVELKDNGNGTVTINGAITLNGNKFQGRILNQRCTKRKRGEKELMYPEKRIISKVNAEHRESGDISETQIMKESFDFCDHMADMYHTKCVMYQNKAIREGIKDLSSLGAWPNLSAIAEDAYEQAVTCCEVQGRDSKIVESVVGLFKLKSALSKMSIPEFKEALKPEFVEGFLGRDESEGN